MSEENKKPEGFSIDDDDIDAMLGIIHHRKDDAPEAPTSSKPQSASVSDASKRPAPNGKASAAADGIHASTNAHADASASANAGGHAGTDTNNGINPNVISASAGANANTNTNAQPVRENVPYTPNVPHSVHTHSPAAPQSAANRTASRPKVVDFDEVDPEGGKLRRRKKLRKNAATGKNAAIGLGKTILYIAAIVGISVFLAVNIINIGNDMFAFVKDDIRTTVTIPEGAGTDEVAKLLKENGIIRYPFAFSLYADHKLKDSDYYTGKYNSGAIRFVFRNEDKTDEPVVGNAANALNSSESTSETENSNGADSTAYSDYVTDSSEGKKALLPMSYDRILSLVAETNYKTRDSVRITIPEGYTVDEILNLLIESGVGEREKYVDAIQNYDYDYRFVKALDSAHLKDGRTYRLEGYLFPDTYDFFTDENEVSVINKFLSNFDAKMENVYYERADELGMSVDDIIIVASIIEKEARLAQDLPIMSSVFHNRLKKGMSLGSDATVMYALPERKKSLTSADLDIDSPYNTHKVLGLPPGAISNPGIEAINAAFYPDSTGYYYFFSLKDGSTVYSVTYDQHTSRLNKAIAEGTLAS